MIHASIRRRLGPYLEGDLDAGRRRRVEAHLATCRACASELEEIRRTVSLLRALPDPEPPPHLVDGIMARVRDEARRPLDSSWRRFLQRDLFTITGAHATVATAAVAGLAAFLVLTGVPLGPNAPLEPTPAAERVALAPEAPAPEPAPVTVADGRASRVRRPTAVIRPSATDVRGRQILVTAPIREGRRPLRLVGFEPELGSRALLEPAVPGEVLPRRESLQLDPSALLDPMLLGFSGTALPLDEQLEWVRENPEAFLDRLSPVPRAGDVVARLARRAAERGDAAEIASLLRRTSHPLASSVSGRFFAAALLDSIKRREATAR